MQWWYGILKQYKNGKKKLKAGTLEILKSGRGNTAKKHQNLYGQKEEQAKLFCYC